MTTSHARGIKQDVLNDNSVADYLLTYPDFFERNSQLLTKLRLPHVRDVAATVSLVERQVEVLRERNQSLERKLKELVDVARANDALADRIHRLSQRLIRTRTLAEYDQRHRDLAARGLRRDEFRAGAVSRGSARAGACDGPISARRQSQPTRICAPSIPC